MTTPEIKYFGSSVYDAINNIDKTYTYLDLSSIANNINSDLGKFEDIFAGNFLAIEKILDENPTAWTNNDFEWQTLYRHISGQVIKLVCLWGYELLSRSESPDFYGKYFASLRTFEERMIKIKYGYPPSDIDDFEYSQLSAPPLNDFDSIGPTILEMIDLIEHTDFTGDYSFMQEVVHELAYQFYQLSWEGVTKKDEMSQDEITLRKDITTSILKLACLFSNSFLPEHTYHSPDMFRAFFHCLHIFQDQILKITFNHPRTQVDGLAVESLV